MVSENVAPGISIAIPIQLRITEAWVSIVLDCVEKSRNYNDYIEEKNNSENGNWIWYV